MFTANDLAQHRTALEASLRQPVLSAARQAARRRDEQLVAIIAEALAPWPVRVFVLADRDDVIRISLGRPDGALIDVPVDRILIDSGRFSAEEVAALVARQARKVWHSLEPLPVPANITVGQE